ncbi:unnamed protein product [Protopolystoma xenopodis]|uniref:Uncharacterized protein n=1 Tax=Protopolystoma xenopodis TaxID=117903 RepID=A0A3S5CR41_9PLAT|nr:unnamed protein product [Protopolystoma xenopodis]
MAPIHFFTQFCALVSFNGAKSGFRQATKCHLQSSSSTICQTPKSPCGSMKSGFPELAQNSSPQLRHKRGFRAHFHAHVHTNAYQSFSRSASDP